MTGVRPEKQSDAAMKNRTATTIRTVWRVPLPCKISSTMPTITPTTPSARAGKPGADFAWYSLTGWAGNFGTTADDVCVFIEVFIAPPALADLIFSFPPEEAPGNQGEDQRVAGQHQQWLRGRELALPRVLDRFHRRPERGEVADLLERARHELTRKPHAGEEQHRVERRGPDRAGGDTAPGYRRDTQPDGEHRGDGEHDRQHQGTGVFRDVDPEGRDARHDQDEQRGDGGAEGDDELGGQHPGRWHRRGREPAQDPLVPVGDQRAGQADERDYRDHHGNEDRHVHVERGQPAEVGLGLMEARYLVEDDQEQHRKPGAEDQAGRQPPGEPDLVADDLAERRVRRRFRQQRPGQPDRRERCLGELGLRGLDLGLRPRQRVRVHAGIPSSCRCRPVSFTNASSRDEVSSCTSRAVTPAVARVRITVLTSSPVPVTTTCEPLRVRLPTSGSSVRRRSSKGAEGTNRMLFPPLARAARPAGLSSATTWPASIRATRSHSRSASSMKCVTSRIVTPRFRTLSIRFQVSRRACGSSPDVISSSTATLGRPIRASAIDSRWRWPPDRDR